MRVVIVPDEMAVCEFAASLVLTRISEFKPSADRPFVLGLPTGGTPVKMYERLVRYHHDGELSFRNVVTFNMDEYVGLPVEHPESYHAYMWRHLFSKVDVQPESVHILNGNAEDLRAECSRFEETIKFYGGVHLFIGGIGTDGHIAFNEPGSSLTSRTRVKTLAEDTRRANARFFDNDLSQVPAQALTVGVGTVMDAREVVILVSGAHKAPALRNTIEKGVNHMCTASAFQLHPRATVVCDEDATLDLRVKTVKYYRELADPEQQ